VVQLQGKQTQDATLMDSGWEGQGFLTLAHMDNHKLGTVLDKLSEVEGIAIPIRKEVREFEKKAVEDGKDSGYKREDEERDADVQQWVDSKPGDALEPEDWEGETEICHTSCSNFRLRVRSWV
jgi:hypothetical protein